MSTMDTGPEGPAAAPTQPVPADTMGLGTTSMGMQPNVAAGVSYIFGWVSGLIFFLTEKQNKFVRFHAMQSICLGAVFAVIWVLYSFLVAGAIATATAAPNAAAGGLGIMGMLFMLIGLAFFVVWVICLIQAFSGKWFKIPVIGEMAMKWSGATPPG